MLEDTYVIARLPRDRSGVFRDHIFLSKGSFEIKCLKNKTLCRALKVSLKEKLASRTRVEFKLFELLNDMPGTSHYKRKMLFNLRGCNIVKNIYQFIN